MSTTLNKTELAVTLWRALDDYDVNSALRVLERGAYPDAPDPRLPVEESPGVDAPKPITPLMSAVRLRDEAVVPLIQGLVGHGADLEAEDDAGWTPILKASFRGNPVAVETLADLGADLDHLSNDGKSIEDLAHDRVLDLVLELRDRICANELEETLMQTRPEEPSPGASHNDPAI